MNIPYHKNKELLDFERKYKHIEFEITEDEVDFMTVRVYRGKVSKICQVSKKLGTDYLVRLLVKHLAGSVNQLILAEEYNKYEQDN